MYYIAVETSCDETSLAILKKTTSKEKNFLTYLNSHVVVSSIIASQAKIFAQYGGVIPEISARHHAEQIFDLFDLVLQETLNKEELSLDTFWKSVDTIFVTTTPGLQSALRVGIEFAKSLCFIIESEGGKAAAEAVNHLHGHTISAFYGTTEQYPDTELFPHLHLLVSGGNTQTLWLENPTTVTIMGQTLDDAAGECLDKIGRMVGLTYPAGATIAKIVGNATENPIGLTVSMKKSESCDFSYSGLKTAVRYYIQKNNQLGITYEQKLTDSELIELMSGNVTTSKLIAIKSILTSAHTVVIEQLIQQFKKAMRTSKPASIGLSGGVSANTLLRSKLSYLHAQFFLAPISLSGDNAVMIGLAGVADRYVSKTD